MRRHRLDEGTVALRSEAVGLGEHDVEYDRPRPLRRQPLDQLAMHCAWPRPAAGAVLHAGEALLVDVDQHNVRVRREPRRVHAHVEIDQAVFQRLREVQPEDLRRRERERGERAEEQGPVQWNLHE